MSLGAFGALRQERNSLDHEDGREIGSEQLEILRISDGMMDGLVDLFGVLTTCVCLVQRRDEIGDVS